VSDFQRYLEKLNQQVGDAAKVKEIIANAVILVSAGNNDLAITYFSTPKRQTRYTVQAYTDMLIGWKTTFINVYNTHLFITFFLHNIVLPIMIILYE